MFTSQIFRVIIFQSNAVKCKTAYLSGEMYTIILSTFHFLSMCANIVKKSCLILKKKIQEIFFPHKSYLGGDSNSQHLGQRLPLFQLSYIGISEGKLVTQQRIDALTSKFESNLKSMQRLGGRLPIFSPSVLNGFDILGCVGTRYPILAAYAVPRTD